MCFNSGEQDTQDYDKASFLMTKTIFYMAWHRSESVQQNEYIYIYTDIKLQYCTIILQE